MKNFEEIKKLKNISTQIKIFYNQKLPHYQLYPKKYDKVGNGFNKDTRFAAHKKFEISFDSWMGEYGNSACGREVILDDDVFRKYLLYYLNLHQKEIMLEIANLIDKEAASMKDKAEKEIKEQLNFLEQL